MAKAACTHLVTWDLELALAATHVDPTGGRMPPLISGFAFSSTNNLGAAASGATQHLTAKEVPECADAEFA